MKIIQWLVSLVPKQARVIVASLLVTTSTLCGVIAFLYKQETNKDAKYNDIIRRMSEQYQSKCDSLTNIIVLEKDKSKKEMIDKLQEIIDDQKSVLNTQQRHDREQRAVISINNTIIQRNSQRIKILKDE